MELKGTPPSPALAVRGTVMVRSLTCQPLPLAAATMAALKSFAASL